MKLPSLPENAHLFDVFRNFPRGLEPLLALHDALLRDEAPLSPGERELIAAYVSGLNGCEFCYGSHVEMAKVFDVDAGVFEGLMQDLQSADVDPRLKPILAYVKKLTLSPSRMVQADVDAVLEAGWSEDALYCAIQVCALFNYMNRIVDGMGIERSEMKASGPKEMLRGPYSGILQMLKQGRPA